MRKKDLNVFDYQQVETQGIKTLSTADDLSNLMRAIKRTPERLVGVESPLGKRPSKMFLRVLPGYALNASAEPGIVLSCSYGSDDGYMLAAVNDTVISYADGTFCILPTGTPARVEAPSL